jgi:hypothetical protein
MSRLELLWLVTNHEKIQKNLWRASDWAGDHVSMSRQPLYHHLLKFSSLETIWFFVCTCGCLLPFRIALTLSDTHSSAISKAMIFVKVIGLQYTFGRSGIRIMESMFEIWLREANSLLVMWPKILSYLCYKIGYVSRLMLSNRNLLLRKGRYEKCVTPLCKRVHLQTHLQKCMRIPFACGHLMPIKQQIYFEVICGCWVLSVSLGFVEVDTSS